MEKNNVDRQYFELAKKILYKGRKKSDRTGTGTVSIFGSEMRFDMSEGFPLLTSKKVFTKAVIHELIWFLRGDTNIKYLLKNDVHIWDGDAYKHYTKTPLDKLSEDECKLVSASHKLFDHFDKDEFIEKIMTDESFCKKFGDLGPIYGHQWRNWGGYSETHLSNEKDENGFLKYYEKKIHGFDQIKKLLDDLRNDPDSRRLIVSAWNVDALDDMKLPPCHYGFQCYTYEMDLQERRYEWCMSLGKDISYSEDVTHEWLDDIEFPKRKISLKWHQRSVDFSLGLPFNIASYAILLHLIANEVGMLPDELIFTGGDTHIYLNQIDGIKEQLKQETFELPSIELSNDSIFDVKFEDIKIVNYRSSKRISMPLSN